MKLAGRIASVLALATALLATHVAYAQATDVDAMIHRGVEMRQRGDDEGALGVFTQAFEATHGAHAEAQLGMAEQALGRWADAERHLTEALAAATDAWIRQHRGTIQSALDGVHLHLGSIEVRGGVPGAEVRIDGRMMGTLPLAQSLRIPVGTVTLEVRAHGFHSVQRQVVVAAGELHRESVDLVAMPAEPSPAPASTSPATIASSSPAPAPSAAPAPAATPARVGSSRTAPIALAAIGAVLGLAAGVSGNVVRENVAQSFNSPACTHNGDTRMMNCGYMLANFDAAQDVAIVGYAVGGVLAVVTVVLLVTAPSPSHDARAATIRCGSGPGDVGVACALRF